MSDYQSYEVRVYPSGSKQWYQNGQRHRLDGPAVEWASGNKYWYQNGLPHRLDGPAIEYINGKREWYIEGQEYTEQDFNKKVLELKNTNSCADKVVETEGKKYKLVEI